MKGTLVFGVICVSLATFASAAPPPKTPADNAVAPSPIPEAALRLSRILNPADKIIELGMKGFDAGVNAELKKKPEDAAVYDRNPGLLDAILASGRPVMRSHIVAGIPAQQQRFAQFYAEKFTPDEIDQLIASYSTPTGTKVVEAMYAGGDFSEVIDAMDKGSGAMSAAAVEKMNSSAAAQLPYKFDADDWKAMFAFAATPAHAKLEKIAPEFNQLVADVGNAPDPTLEIEMNSAIEGAVKAYFANKKHP
jgi:hypothetical protein